MLEPTNLSIDDMKRTLKSFEKQLKGIEEITYNSGCKIGVHNNETYVTWYWFQSVQRYYYSENREKLLVLLRHIFADNLIFYQIVSERMLVETNKEEIFELDKLYEKYNLLIAKWYEGLGHLSKQYNKEDEIYKFLEMTRESLYLMLN